MKIVSYNIQYGVGADGQLDLQKTAKAVEGADIIALQEVDRYWQRTGMLDQPAIIARTLPDYYWVYGPNLDMDASYHDGKGKLVNRRKQFGTMLLAKMPFLSSRNFPLPKLSALRQHSIQQGVLEGVVNAPDGPLRIYSVHLSHLVAEARKTQIKALLDIYASAPSEGGAWCGGHPDPSSGWIEEAEPPMPRRAIMMGDFNLTADMPEYDQIVGPLSVRHGRVNQRDGFVDSWVAAGNAEETGITCPIKSNETGDGKRIDYCFVTSDLAPKIKAVHIDNGCQASDHQPYWVELDLGW